MATTVLVTGFGPFPGAPFNPTTPLVKQLVRSRRSALAGVRCFPHVFRVSYAAVERELPALLTKHRPDVVLLFGLATRTAHLRIETRAVNARAALLPDVDGHMPGRAISAGGPGSLAGRAPHRKLLAAARATGVPVVLSRDAGQYLCNFIYWRALEQAGRSRSMTLVQFVHVPQVRRGPARRPAKRRRLVLPDLIRAGEAILLALVGVARQRTESLGAPAKRIPPPPQQPAPR